MTMTAMMMVGTRRPVAVSLVLHAGWPGSARLKWLRVCVRLVFSLSLSLLPLFPPRACITYPRSANDSTPPSSLSSSSHCFLARVRGIGAKIRLPRGNKRRGRARARDTTRPCVYENNRVRKRKRIRDVLHANSSVMW